MLNPDEIKLDRVLCGDSRKILSEFPDNFFDSVVTDPPYEIGFCNRAWDSSGIAFDPKFWGEVLRVSKPGATMFCFGGSRTYHRIACAIEDAGWEIRDSMMWIYGCLSEDTEILTTEGWKDHNSIQEQDTVFSLNLERKCIIQNNVNEIFKYRHKGKMVSLKNHNTEQLVTRNHKVITKLNSKVQICYTSFWELEEDWTYKQADQIHSGHHLLPLAGKYDGNYSIGEDFAEVIGWVLTEGCFHRPTNAITIYQSSVNSEYIPKIRNCLKGARISYNERQRLRNYKGREYIEYSWYIGNDGSNRIKEIIPDKKPTKKLWNLKIEEKERLLFGLCAGDGSKSRNKPGKYSAFNQKDIDFLNWFQVLLHLTGKQGWINEKKYYCSIHYNDNTQLQAKHNKNRLIDYDGIVWCINTDTGNFVARRNGKIFITGNSGFPKSHDISKAIDKSNGAKREVIGSRLAHDIRNNNLMRISQGLGGAKMIYEYTAPSTDLAKQWSGYGTALKPSFEPLILAQKPLDGTFAQNAEKWGVAGLNIDAGRIGAEEDSEKYNAFEEREQKGRWPANIILSHSPDCVHVGTKQIGKGKYNDNITRNAKPSWKNSSKDIRHITYGQETIDVWACVPDCPIRIMDSQSGQSRSTELKHAPKEAKRHGDALKLNTGNSKWIDGMGGGYSDSGGASRFFYCTKASRSERESGLKDILPCVKCGQIGTETHNLTGDKENCIRNNHPTVKPFDLLIYLCKLIKMPEHERPQVILDPFCGSGTTLLAAQKLGLKYIGIDQEAEHTLIATARRIDEEPDDESIEDTIDLPDVEQLSSNDFGDLLI